MELVKYQRQDGLQGTSEPDSDWAKKALSEGWTKVDDSIDFSKMKSSGKDDEKPEDKAPAPAASSEETPASPPAPADQAPAPATPPASDPASKQPAKK